MSVLFSVSSNPVGSDGFHQGPIHSFSLQDDGFPVYHTSEIYDLEKGTCQI